MQESTQMEDNYVDPDEYRERELVVEMTPSEEEKGSQGVVNVSASTDGEKKTPTPPENLKLMMESPIGKKFVSQDQSLIESQQKVINPDDTEAFKIDGLDDSVDKSLESKKVDIFEKMFGKPRNPDETPPPSDGEEEKIDEKVPNVVVTSPIKSPMKSSSESVTPVSPITAGTSGEHTTPYIHSPPTGQTEVIKTYGLTRENNHREEPHETDLNEDEMTQLETGYGGDFKNGSFHASLENKGSQGHHSQGSQKSVVTSPKKPSTQSFIAIEEEELLDKTLLKPLTPERVAPLPRNEFMDDAPDTTEPVIEEPVVHTTMSPVKSLVKPLSPETVAPLPRNEEVREDEPEIIEEPVLNTIMSSEIPEETPIDPVHKEMIAELRTPTPPRVSQELGSSQRKGSQKSPQLFDELIDLELKEHLSQQTSQQSIIIEEIPTHHEGRTSSTRKRGRGETVTPNKKKTTSPPKILFTGINDQAKAEYEAIVKKLKGVVVTDMSNATHLVTDTIRRTVKFLMAMNQAETHILNVNWILDSKRQKTFVDEAEYTLTNPEVERNYGFNMLESLKRRGNHPDGKRLFSGMSFLVTPNVEKPGRADLCEMIKSGDGTIVTKDTPDTIVISCEKDAHLVAKLKSKHIYSNDSVLSSILNQESDFTANKINF